MSKSTLSVLVSEDAMSAPYSLESKPLMHYGFLHGRADRRAHRPPRPRREMATSSATAYFHGYYGHKWRRLPSGQLIWDEGQA